MADPMFDTTSAEAEPEVQQQEAVKQEEGTPAAQQQPQPNELFADQLSEIREADGRQKYADVETALKSIPHSQAHIARLEQELASLREELQSKKGAEELMTYLQSGGTVNSPPASEADPVKNDLDVSELVKKELATLQAQQAQQRNTEAVRSELLNKYGEKAAEVFESKARELGVTTQYLTEQAALYPKVVLAHFGTQPQSHFNATNPVISSKTTETSQQHQQVERRSVMRGATSRDVLAQWRAHSV